MQFRKSDPAAVATAKAGFSPGIAYRLEENSRLPSQEKQLGSRRRAHPLDGVWDKEVRLETDRRVRGAITRSRPQRAPHAGAAHSRTIHVRVQARGCSAGSGTRRGFFGSEEPGEFGSDACTVKADAAGRLRDVAGRAISVEQIEIVPPKAELAGTRTERDILKNQ